MGFPVARQSSYRAGSNLPPRKPLNKHKQALTVTIEPEHRQWLREHFMEYRFRSESHAIDEAIKLLRETKEREHGSKQR